MRESTVHLKAFTIAIQIPKQAIITLISQLCDSKAYYKPITDSPPSPCL